MVKCVNASQASLLVGRAKNRKSMSTSNFNAFSATAMCKGKTSAWEEQKQKEYGNFKFSCLRATAMCKRKTYDAAACERDSVGRRRGDTVEQG